MSKFPMHDNAMVQQKAGSNLNGLGLRFSLFFVQECKCALCSVAKGHHHHGLLILTFFGSCIQPTVHSSGALKLGDL
jgi:hypothetical protein